MIIMVSIGLFFAMVQEAVYFFHNRRVAKNKPQPGEEDLLTSPPYIYVL